MKLLEIIKNQHLTPRAHQEIKSTHENQVRKARQADINPIDMQRLNETKEDTNDKFGKWLEKNENQRMKLLKLQVH